MQHVMPPKLIPSLLLVALMSIIELANVYLDIKEHFAKQELIFAKNLPALVVLLVQITMKTTLRIVVHAPLDVLEMAVNVQVYSINNNIWAWFLHVVIVNQTKVFKIIENKSIFLFPYRKWSNERPLSDKRPCLKSAPPKSKIVEINALSNKHPPKN